MHKRYQVVFSKEDVIPGYLLGGIVSSLGIDCDFKAPEFDRSQSFFVRQQSIPREIFFNFYPKIRIYDLDTVSAQVEQVLEILST